MRLGRFGIPETRLVPTCLDDTKSISTSPNYRNLSPKELAALLGYTDPRGGAYYRRSSSLLYYGLLKENADHFELTELGQIITYSTEDKTRFYSQAVLNVELWKELYTRHGKDLPENLAVHLRNLAAVDLIQAQKYEKDIRRWYEEDISLVSNEFAQEQERKSYMQLDTNNQMQSETSNMMSTPSTTTPPIENRKEEIEEYSFESGRVLVRLPKENKKEIWKTVSRVMNIYLDVENEKSSPDS